MHVSPLSRQQEVSGFFFSFFFFLFSFLFFFLFLLFSSFLLLNYPFFLKKKGYPAPGDSGDNWKVICLNNNGKALNDNSFWERGNPIRLQHVETSKYLTTSRNYAYQNPIPGQLEVFIFFTFFSFFFPFIHSFFF